MKKEYQYFHNILIGYFQGTITEKEIKSKKDLPFKIESQWCDFVANFENSLRNYDKGLYFEWEQYKEYAEDTAPTVKGLLHSLNELIKQNISQDEFIEWACWHNVDCGETTSGRFENQSIEFFCEWFIPERYTVLDSNFYQQVLSLIEKSNEITYEQFKISLYLLLEKERKSLYFFLKGYIDGNKSEDDLDKYLRKKFKFNLSYFPYLEELNQYKKEHLDIGDFIKIMEK